MRTFLIVLIGVAALLTQGCRSNPNEMLLERDLRMQEDKIYQLQGMLEDCHSARETVIHENESLKRQLASGGPSSDARGPSFELPRPDREPSPRSRRGGSVPEAPSIELPREGGGPAVEWAPGDSSAALGNGQPTQLVINNQLTGGLDRDGQDGDEGILVVFEPRDISGRLVKASGTVSVVVMDPSLTGAASRIARWDFSAEEVPSHFRTTGFGPGLQFELFWPGESPKNRDLQLFVRLTTSKGQKLTADTEIGIRTSSSSSQPDRQTKNPTTSTARSTRSGPESRLRSGNAPGGASGSTAPSEENDSPEPTRSTNRRNGDPPREAARNDRPVWKPYR